MKREKKSEGSVNNISISFDEKFIAFSSEKGVICVLELNDDGSNRLISRSLEHSGTEITTLTWTKHSQQLYIGDSVGRLSVINISISVSKNIFQLPAYVFMLLDSCIVQLCANGNYLLVSTKSRCYICDTVKEEYQQIGTKLRDGYFGACFYNSKDGIKLYCARPGSRLWEVDITGKVLNTHNFRKSLTKESGVVINYQENEITSNFETSSCSEQSFNFCILYPFLDKFLFTYKINGIYVLDPEKADVVLWSGHYNNIQSIKCVNETIYIWTFSGELQAATVIPLDKCLLQLYFLGKYRLCLDLLGRYFDDIKSFEHLSRLTPLLGLKDHVLEYNENKKLDDFFNLLKKAIRHRGTSLQLNSGIFLVQNRYCKKNIFGYQNDIRRTKSFSDLRCLSLKESSQSNKRFVSSLPQLQFHFSEKLLKNGIKHIVYSNYLPSLIPHISLFSFGFPETIYSTLLEVRHNVSNKLHVNSKSVYGKSNSLERKLQFSNRYCINETFTSEERKSGLDDLIKIDCQKQGNENIVFKQSNFVKEPKLFTSEITEICRLCDEHEKDVANENITFHLFDCIIQCLLNLNENLNSNSPSKKSFPFTQLIPVKYLTPIKNSFHSFLTISTIQKYLDAFQNSFNHNFLDYKEHPTILTDIHPKKDLLNDICLANILFIFSEILDPYRVLDCLEKSRLMCIFMSWSTVLDIFQESSFNYITKEDNNSSVRYTEWPLPLLLNYIFLMFRLDQVESCFHTAVEVNLKLYHISYVILKLSLHLELTGINSQLSLDKCNKLILNYVLKICQNKLPINELCKFEFLRHIETAFLYVNRNHNVLKCNCKYPLLGSSKFICKYPEIGEFLMTSYLYMFKEETSEGFDVKDFECGSIFINENICRITTERNLQNIKFATKFLKSEIMEHDLGLNPDLEEKYSKIIVLLQTMPDLITIIKKYVTDDLTELAPFIVQFGKIECLEDMRPKHAFEFWNNIFYLNLKLSEGECCICSQKSGCLINVDWNSLSLLILKSLGPQETIKLLLSFADNIPHDQINLSFYRLCILSGSLPIDEINSSIFDQFYSTFQNFDVIDFEASEELDFTSSGNETKISTENSSIETDSGHDTCTYCSNVLFNEKTNKKRAVIRIFKCGHIYHNTCLQMSNNIFKCPLCKKHGEK